jgi:hypothetical protein
MGVLGIVCKTKPDHRSSIHKSQPKQVEEEENRVEKKKEKEKRG